ncbi:hypothetical protein K443DRAFT_5824 [Laccaria amethystina LaAM-08-1]|uniref:Uncharacterized protein n=1 Tax=Laccaria amethystina LaAM-08-1 TaxID=1095629 RepID=A0A0C9XMP2_9AGAR|nr:hypothetical protein K443DRAFT_5824 [Laccaria amethystina LaAM-08-1]
MSENFMNHFHPDHQPPPFKLGGRQQTSLSLQLLRTMSSSVPSAGDDNLKNKSHSTNNSASQDFVTLLTTRKKGKGVSMTKEPDPKAKSPTNHSPMPVSGPILTGPYSLDFMNLEGISINPTAPQSVNRVPVTNKDVNKLLAAPKSANNPRPSFLNKTVQKALTASVNQLAAQDRLSQKALVPTTFYNKP